MSQSDASRVAERLEQLKQQHGAVILAHNYQRPEVQDVADFTGDSLELSRIAARTEARTVVFCGVHFMAETAAILSPDKVVLLPERTAGCPMADMANAEELRRLKRQHPDAVVVTYVNSSAEVKAESDYCCTSANAVQVVAHIPAEREIIFVPDQYLGKHVQRVTGRELILWQGYCPIHASIRPEQLLELKREHPQAEVMVHPECTPETAALADHVLSTGGMCRHAASAAASTFIVGTEPGILHRLRNENPGKTFIPACGEAICVDMKKIDLEMVPRALERMEHRVEVAEQVRVKAKAALDRMLAI